MKKMIGLMLLGCYAIALYGSGAVISNMTDEKMYAAIYCVDGTKGVRLANPVLIKEAEYKKISYACKKGSPTIIVDRSDAELRPIISSELLKERRMAVEPIGFQETNFFIVKKEGRLKVYNSFRWYLFKPLKSKVGETVDFLTEPLASKLKKTLRPITRNIHKNKKAVVRIGNSLPVEETAYLASRLNVVKKNIEKHLSAVQKKTVTLEGKPPIIACIFSGGGYRAMISTLGFVSGAVKAGIFDSVSYVVGLSGSTWGLGTWMSNGFPIEKFKEKFYGMLTGGLKKLSSSDLSLMVDNFETKMVFRQPITIVDAYGALLANELFANFGQQKQMLHLSTLKNMLTTNRGAIWPIPIFTAIRAEEQAKSEWYEFTPYEVGASWLGMYVPTWAWGRKFINGESIDNAPEQPLGFDFGTFGSAFGAKFGQTYEAIIDATSSSPVKILFEKKILPSIKEKRPAYAEVFNFTAGIPGSPIRELKVMQLVDAGSSPGFNLPYPPVSGERPERKADILLFVDASAGTLGEDFNKVVAYARANRLPFPEVDFSVISKSSISVFKNDNDPSVPVVIYMPLIIDQVVLQQKLKEEGFGQYKILEGFAPRACMENSFCNTFNFVYQKEQAEQLSAVYEFNVRASSERIIEVIQEWLTKRGVIKLSA